ncbi:hypothetical protein TA5113_01957 [Cognatishimia activa]|nr:hypothetical protein TA5113_01957 [Cognatishimia activa]
MVKARLSSEIMKLGTRTRQETSSGPVMAASGAGSPAMSRNRAMSFSRVLANMKERNGSAIAVTACSSVIEF